MKISGESCISNGPLDSLLGSDIHDKPRFAWPPSREVAHLTWEQGDRSRPVDGVLFHNPSSPQNVNATSGV